jgi:hypothetical protein
MLDQIAKSLKAHLDDALVEELLNSYQDAKHNFFLGGLRLGEVEGGRFCEAAFRLLQQIVIKKFTPLGKRLDADSVALQLSNTASGSFPDSVRLHIPRALRVVYDVRNNRDAAHLADGIDPNLQDASLVIGNIDWVLAEFVRLYHSVSPDEAQRIIDALVVRKVPVVQDFDGFLKVLNPKLRVTEFILVLLYERGTAGASYEQLAGWVRPRMRRNLRRTLNKMVDVQAYIHSDAERFRITKLGMRVVEAKKLHAFP